MTLHKILAIVFCAAMTSSAAFAASAEPSLEVAHSVPLATAGFTDYGGVVWWRGPSIRRDAGDFSRLKFARIQNPDREQASLVIRDSFGKELQRIDLTELHGLPAIATGRFIENPVQASIEAAKQPINLKLELAEYFTASKATPELLSIVTGGSPWKVVATLPAGSPQLKWRSGIVNILFLATMQSCSGFLVAGNQVMTNRHCIENSTYFQGDGKSCQDVEIQFDYFLEKPTLVTAYCERARASSGKDIALLQIRASDKAKLKDRHVFKLAVNTTAPQDAQLLHHPAGTSMKLSDQCKLVDRIDDDSVHHSCNSVQGSSGAALLDKSGNVIGIQYLGIVMSKTDFDYRTARGEVFYNTAVDAAKVRQEFEELK